jgi:hypothetical protein
VNYSPPLGYMSQPHSLLSTSPQTVMMDQRRYSAASMTHSTSQGRAGSTGRGGGGGGFGDRSSEEFNTLPESPFTRSSHHYDGNSPFGGHDSLPRDGGSILSSMYGMNLGVLGGSSSLQSGGLGGNPLDNPLSDLDDGASFPSDLPFACNDMDEDSSFSGFGNNNNNQHDNGISTASSSSSSSVTSSSFPVSSFVSLVDSAPKLSLTQSALVEEETSNFDQTIDDELRELKLFGQALKM